MKSKLRFMRMTVGKKLTADDGDDLDDQDGGYWEGEIDELDDR